MSFLARSAYEPSRSRQCRGLRPRAGLALPAPPAGRRRVSSNVLIAVLLGVVLGAVAQGLYGFGSPAVTGTMTVGGRGRRHLRAAAADDHRAARAGLDPVGRDQAERHHARSARSAPACSALLIATTAVASVIGIVVTHALRPARRGPGARRPRTRDAARPWKRAWATWPAINIPSLLQSFVPTNIFADLAGTRSTSVMGVVVFAAMLGFAVLTLRKDNPELGERIVKGIETLQALILRLVRMVLRLTPYGVLALMTRVVATSNVNDIYQSGRLRRGVLRRPGAHPADARRHHHRRRPEPGALLPEDLADAHLRLHVAVERARPFRSASRRR